MKNEDSNNTSHALYKMLGTVTDCYEKAEKTASEVVEKMARKILQEHNELNEFVMGMGTYFFTLKDGDNLDESSHILKPLDDFIGEWDSRLKITGEAMRFTVDGTKVTKW